MTRRLVLSYLLITIGVLLLLEVPLAVFYQQRELDRLTVDVERDATVMATIYEDALEEGGVATSRPADDYAARTGARVVVVDSGGISIVDTAAESPRDFSTRPEVDAALSGQRASGTRRSDTLDTDLLYVAVPVASGGDVHGAVRLTLDTDEVTERIWRFWIGLAAVGIVVVVVMAGVSWLIARSVTRPVRRLQLAADRFSSGDLTPTEPDPAAVSELAALEAALNAMATRLDTLIAQQRQFVADASHQLRTPLTALRLRLENLRSEADSSSAEQLDAAINETTRLGELVSDLLQLAKAEKPAPPVVVDLARLVPDRVDVWSATADDSGVRLEMALPDDDVHVCALAGGLEQVLDNVLDNAIRCAPSGSPVHVRVSAGSSAHTIEIADDGPGLSDDDKIRAVDRFWRADVASDGTGLGLPIAAAIVAASGGEISLSDNTPTGLVVTVTVPSCEPDPSDDGAGVESPGPPVSGRSC